LASETSKKRFNSTRKNHLKEKLVRIPIIIERAHFRGPRAVSDEISKYLGCEWHYNASTCWKESTFQILYDENLTNVLRSCQDEQSCSWWCAIICFCVCFWPTNSPDLNPMDYYVWNIIERVTNKSRHPNMTSLQAAIQMAFTSMDKNDCRQRASASKQESKQSSKQKEVI